jgi:predicted nucleic acid-binding protein
MIFVDTSYLLALANPRDSLHARAQAWAGALNEPCVLTDYVLCEMVNALSMPVNRPKAHLIVGQVRSSRDCERVPASLELFDAGLHLHAKRTDKEWSLTDCLSFLVMESRGITRALTYDRHFEQAGFEALLRRDPP